MAEINTGSTDSAGFVFGQDMEKRVIKPSPEAEKDGPPPEGENGAQPQSNSSQPPSLLRPSAFKPSGLIAPSRLGNNPFVSSNQSNNTTAPHNSESQGVLAAGQLATNPFAARMSVPHTSVSNSDSEEANNPILASPRFTLKPSQLDKHTAGFVKNAGAGAGTSAYKSSFRLEPAKLKSPLCKDKDASISKGGDSAASAEQKQTSTPGAAAENNDTTDTQSRDENEAPNGEAEAADDSKPNASSSSQEEADGAKAFVFGENLHERVTHGSSAADSSSSSSSGFVFGQNLADRATPSKQSSTEVEEEKVKSPKEPTSSPTQTLAESAAAHEAKKCKPELQEVQVLTGEENESNVFQLNARLFQFDKDKQTWLERGRGLLRLNDMCTSDESNFQSRLVMRTTGILRLVLNTKIWPGMIVDRASTKSLRISAVDSEDGTVKVFLIMANPKDTDQIFSAIDWRVQQMKMRERSDEPTTPVAGDDAPIPGIINEDSSSCPPPQKRQQEEAVEDTVGPKKKARVENPKEESNDSSTLDPETEASNESCSSTIKSSSSE